MPVQSSKQSTGSATTVRGQMNTPVTSVSQPTTSEPLADQVQAKVESVPLSELQDRFYEISEDEILLDETIIAKPIFINEAYKIKPKDKHYAFLWGHFGRDGNSLRYSQLKAMGFQNASEDDLLPKEQGGHQATVDGGKLLIGDVILMKMQRNKYLAHLKHNMQKSSDMLTPQKIHEVAKGRMGTIVTGSRGMPSLDKHKGEVFIPSQADIRDVPVTPQSAVEQKVYEVVTRD